MACEYLEYAGVRFRRGGSGHYERTIRLHEYALLLSGEPLQPGKSLHHIDGNKDNNAVENLIYLSPDAHQRLHHTPGWDGLKKEDLDESKRFVGKNCLMCGDRFMEWDFRNQSLCKKCVSIHSDNEYYKKNKSARQAYARNRYLNNKRLLLDRQRDYRARKKQEKLLVPRDRALVMYICT